MGFGVAHKEITTHSSILAWRIPWTEEPGRLQSMESQRVGHDWVHTHIMSSNSLFPLLFLQPFLYVCNHCPVLMSPLLETPIVVSIFPITDQLKLLKRKKPLKSGKTEVWMLPLPLKMQHLRLSSFIISKMGKAICFMGLPWWLRG